MGEQEEVWPRHCSRVRLFWETEFRQLVPTNAPRGAGLGLREQTRRPPSGPSHPSQPPLHQPTKCHPLLPSLPACPPLPAWPSLEAQTLARWKVRGAVRIVTERMGWREGPDSMRPPRKPGEGLGTCVRVEGTLCAAARRRGQGFRSHHPSSERSDLPAEGATWPELSPYRTVWLWEGPQAPHLQKTERRAPRPSYARTRRRADGRAALSGAGAVKRPELPGPPPHAPTASCTAVRTEASSLNTEDTFRKAETTFSGSDVSV